MDGREMYAEVNALVGAIGKGFSIEAAEAVKALEAGEIAIEMDADERAERYLSISYRGKSIRIYQGAILYPSEPVAPAEEPAGEEAECQHGGCGCGR